MAKRANQRHNFFAAGFITCLMFLSACASTGGANSQENNGLNKSQEANGAADALIAALQSSEIDTSITHEIGPISCPDKIGGVSFTEFKEFSAQGTNVACIYSGSERFYTLYAYDQRGRLVGDELRGVVDTVLTARKDWQLVYDKDISKTCALNGLLLAIDLGQGAKGSNITIDPDEPIGDTDGYDFAIGVLTGDNAMSLAAIHSRDDIFFKIRGTRFEDKGFSESEIIQECTVIAQAMRALDNEFDVSKVNASDKALTET